jgi:hypothetical protein
MMTVTRIDKVDLIAPNAVGVYLADDDGPCAYPVVIHPNDFITDFSTFLVAVRAADAVYPVERRLLRKSWHEARRLLRKRLVDEDPWGQHAAPLTPATDEPPNYWSMVLCMGEEGAQRLLMERRKQSALA